MECDGANIPGKDTWNNLTSLPDWRSYEGMKVALLRVALGNFDAKIKKFIRN